MAKNTLSKKEKSMEAILKDASFESKSKFSLPEGAEIIKKSYNISVEEIENGFVIRKSYDIEYQTDERKDYAYYTKKWFSKKNPMQIADVEKETPLEDKLD